MIKAYSDIFKESWLFEMPRLTGVSGHNPYPDLLLAVESNIESGMEPKSLSNGLFELLIDNSNMYYWIENDGNIDIISYNSKYGDKLVMNLVGKRNGGKTYASDFYEMILKNSGVPLLFSGDLLSSQASDVWKHLLNNGKKIFVYNTELPDNYTKLTSIDDLEKYLGDTKDFEKYRYVLSENINLVESYFNLHKAYRLTLNLDK